MTDPMLKMAIAELDRALEHVASTPPFQSARSSRDLAIVKIQEALWWTQQLAEEAS